jgi:hypothetical protein
VPAGQLGQLGRRVRTAEVMERRGGGQGHRRWTLRVARSK